MSGALAVGVDIGGTKVAAGVVTPDGEVVARARRDTPHRSTSPAVVESVIIDVVGELLTADVVAVGIGAAGFVSTSTGRVVFSPHLSWRDEPLCDRLAAKLPVPVLVDNDANTACWAEHRFGAVRDERNVVMVNLGTGIGGAVLLGGEVQRGEYGIAGEFGHMQVIPGGHRCECGNRGCWEQYASGNALVREARSLIESHAPIAKDLADRCGDDPLLLTGPMVTEAAREGDPTAQELLAEVGQWLGVGIAGLANAFDPACFVIGGGVSAAGDLLLEPARVAFRRQLTGRGYRPEARIVAAQLGNEAGLVGAADLARRRVA